MFKLKDIEFKSNLFLAPMAGVNCTSFRLLCKKYGAGLVYTQMYEVSKIIELKDELESYLNILEEEKPVAIQLVGSHNDDWETAVKLIEPFCDIIDINFGCIEPKILGIKGGCYLMKHEHLLLKVVENVRSYTKKPLSVKLRLGWDNNSINVIDICMKLEKIGVDMLAVHARTRVQKYSGKANWNLLEKIRKSISIPFVANGDVRTKKDIQDIIAKTKCDFVMIGREAMKNPMIFSGIENPNKKKLVLEFLNFYEKYEKRNSFNEIKEHSMRLIVGDKNASFLKQKFLEAKNTDELKKILNS